ncbi:MAG: Gfo/Idh/MocA family protein [Kiritimatiellia bacterium]
MAFLINRRDFTVATSSAAAAVLAGTGRAEPVAGYKPPAQILKGQLVKGRKVNIAAVGVGGMGLSDCSNWGGENVVALCDVDDKASDAARKRYPNAKYYKDFRKMFAEMADTIDAVSVSTPDHMHYPIALAAIQLGKHVYVQKPLTHTIEEARHLREAAKVHQVKTQMGNQGHSNQTTRLCKEWLNAGLIGDVARVDIWTNRPIWPQGCKKPTPAPVPPHLDWNLWQGVARKTDYSPAYLPFNWRGWWEYGCGAIGDMGCHTMDAAYWALDLRAPTRVELLKTAGNGNELSPPTGAVVRFHFSRRGNLCPCVMTWYEGSCRPPMPDTLEKDRNLGTSGQLFYGTKGILHGGGDYCNSVSFVPHAAKAELLKTRPPQTLPRIPRGDHYANWLDAIKGKIDEACSNFDYAAGLSELGALGNLAIRTGKSFDWDSAAMRCSDPDVQRFVSKTYCPF